MKEDATETMKATLQRDFQLSENAFTPLQASNFMIINLKDLDKNRQSQIISDLFKSRDIETSRPVLIAADGKEVVIDDGFYVKLKQETSFQKLKDFASQKNCILNETPYKHDDKVFFLKAGIVNHFDGLQLANVFYESGLFQYSEPDFRGLDILNASPPNDPFFPGQWAAKNDGTVDQGSGTIGADIRLLDAWDITMGSSQIKIAVLDQGIDRSHPDLINNLTPIGFGLGANNATTGDILSAGLAHGTACAGIIAAQANNNLGIAGVAPLTKLIPVNVIVNTDGAFGSYAQIAQAIDWSWDDGEADVLSNSWGGGPPSSLLHDAIDRAVTLGRNGKGSVVVFSSGNDNSGTIEYPAKYSKTIAVGAINMCYERKTPTSCDGEPWNDDGLGGSNYGSGLDIAAPGTLIYTTVNTGLAPNPNSAFGAFSGTSAATPFVSGVAALILSVNSDLTQSQVREIIEGTARKVGTYSYTNVPEQPNGSWTSELGHGMLNAHDAVIAAQTAGCQNTSKYPSAPVIANSTLTTIATCTWFGEYSEISGIVSNQDYKFTVTGNGYITVRTGSFNGSIVSTGYSPLTITSPNSNNLFVHWNADVLCGTGNACKVTTVECLICPDCPILDASIGDACDDGLPNTQNNIVTANCECVGQLLNDNCANAIAFDVGETGIDGTNKNATPDGPAMACAWGSDPIQKDVWYSFVSPQNGKLIIETSALEGASNFDSQIQLLDGCNGNVIGCDEDSGDYTFSKIVLECGEYTPGHTYYVQIDGYYGYEGKFKLSVINPPCNDDCDGVIALECGVPYLGTNYGATLSGMDTPCSGVIATDDLDVWYSFESDGNSNYAITLSQRGNGQNWDGAIYLYSGGCGNLIYESCMDYHWNSTPEVMSINGLDAGTYYIRTFLKYGGQPHTIKLTCSSSVECVNTVMWPASSTTIPPDLTTIPTCIFLKWYSQFTGIISNGNYEFTVTGNGYITVRTGSTAGPVVATGYSPLTITAPNSNDLFVHWNADNLCGEGDICETATVQYIQWDCPSLNANIGDDCDDGNSNTLYDKVNASCECVGSLPQECQNTYRFPGNTIMPGYPLTTISECSFFGDYTQISSIAAGQLYEFTITGNGYITVRTGSFSGSVVAAGFSPLTITAPNSDDLFAHWNADAICGTQNTCQTTTVQAIIDCSAFEANIAYVNASAEGANNGSSWTDAFTNLQDALTFTCTNVTQVWVANGTYFPDQGGGNISGDPEATFNMKDNIAIYGGFVGTETAISQRNPVANVTTLSGDIGTLDTNTDNSYNVVTSPGTNNTSRLDGFTITGGNAISGSNERGGGIHIGDNSTAIIANCIIQGNKAAFGGGIYTKGATNPTIINCLVTGNIATSSGGGILNSVSGFSTVINTTIAGNTKHGVSNYSSTSSSILKNCIIWGNETGIGGGGLSTVSNSIVQGGYSGTGNLNSDPNFVDPIDPGLNTEGDYNLQATSSAINAGSNTSYTDAGGDLQNDMDLANNPRLYNGVIDMGAFEDQANPPANDNCDSTVALVCGQPISVNTFNATSSGLDSYCGPYGAFSALDIWHSFEADGVLSYTVTISSTTSFWDGVLFLYSGSCSNLVYEACSDFAASPFNGPETITEVLPAGTYYVRTFNYSGASSYTIELTCEAPDCPDQGLNIGDTCDDGNSTTENDVINSDCECIGTPIVMGCTDPTSCNYNPAATIDDGSCEFGLWYLPIGYPTTLPAVTACDGAPDGYELAENQACVAATIADDPYCTNGQFDGICTNSYYDCIYDCPTLLANIGDACDDGNQETHNDTVNENCNCVGTSNDAILNGSVIWNLNCGTRDATLTLYIPGTAIEIVSYTLAIQSDGTFIVPEIEIGTFDMIVKVDGYLAKGTQDVVIVAGNNSLNVGAILFGDFNNDNVANIFDFTTLIDAFLSSAGDPAYNPIVDSDCNNVINLFDFTTLLGSFLTVGDTAPLIP